MTSTARRASRQRTAVVGVPARTGARLPQRAGDPRRAAGPAASAVGLATVYRALQALADAGEVDVLRTDEGEAVYRRCSAGHHHHLVCRECGRTVEVEGPAVERWADTVAAEHGFSDVAHTVEIFGPARPLRRRLTRRAGLEPRRCR